MAATLAPYPLAPPTTSQMRPSSSHPASLEARPASAPSAPSLAEARATPPPPPHPARDAPVDVGDVEQPPARSPRPRPRNATAATRDGDVAADVLREGRDASVWSAADADAETTAGAGDASDDDLDAGAATDSTHARRRARASCFVAWERDLLNLYVAFATLAAHLKSPETLLGFLVATASTLAYCLLPPSSDGAPTAAQHLAARLDFTLLGTAIVFPITFLVNETFRRRETALQRLAHFRALACQLQAALVMWRWKDARATQPPQEWEDHVAAVLHEAVATTSAILLLPKWSANRHLYTAQGRAYRRRVVERQRALTRRFVRAVALLHAAVEQLKGCGLTPSEATRLNQYTYLLHQEFESLVMIKSYRTTSIARSFARCMVLVCPAFYGPYYAWVAYDSGADPGFGFGFALALSLITTTVLQGLVKVQRALEDPFTSMFPAEVIAVQEEADEALASMGVVRAVAREVRGY